MVKLRLEVRTSTAAASAPAFSFSVFFAGQPMIMSMIEELTKFWSESESELKVLSRDRDMLHLE